MSKKIEVIAEIGNTHEGSLGLAKQFIKVAAECGVDCVKLQTHIFEAESLSSAPNPPYFKDETRKEYFERTAFDLKQYCELKRYTEEECGVEFMSSPFSLEAVDLLEEVGVKSYKVASGEVTNIPLLKKIAATGKRVLLSSGMSSWNELDEAVKTLEDNGCSELIILQCTSEYPCPPQEAGLNILDEMKQRYIHDIGYSDHTLGVAVPLTAVVKGAVLIEKHFTLSQGMYGSDAKNSTEPEEFKRLVDEIRQVEIALQCNVDKDAKASTLRQMKMTFEKSIVSKCRIAAGQIISEDMLAFKKPGEGIPTNKLASVVGKTSLREIEANIMLKVEWLS